MTVYTHVARINCCEPASGTIHYLSEGYVPEPCSLCGAPVDTASAEPITDGWSFFSSARKRWEFSVQPPSELDRPRRIRQIIGGVLQACAEDA